ncbi:NEDD8-conjugating enzyme UBC12, putative [Plasmodium knowlesi strain H]|uniref:NEDD8-conjugating enzyme UBC12, putative n=3 Tax=Plasmodium knowlesi TaxID=5850 RepID=A0A1A7W4Y8_PLAKH|nr:NEDD8-conjugating enzyme UBC12, putative [Plasmodium knowlesi strain H]OTN64071.1 putative NEDD8-conjugating enzyme UBC12 [Plasmodium knowlesi]CAA9991247.1 NEDD8-conjugating enzyme UBC12, putative [Plasmodium knowlesi strain H]SBO26325.1 NEDD8-conjugating enzyme UBC12, putative [Plasmodium knowlesi strain H]SBO29045.1 NEDD8-conjugating enzyme UBC12, putative [Plasmodium knowlesi strain H]VVS80721.1 NEDD8-conjugating enzyme UBC12, putative [Plasmodium knowlesi strain H]
MSNESGKKLQPFELVLQKEILDLDPIDGVQLQQIHDHTLKEIGISVTPKESYFRGKTVSFVIMFKDTYPIAPPKIKCQSKIFHPNIDERGNVCLNVLKLEWNPIINLQMLILGLLLLLNEPSTEDPFNQAAAEMFVKDKKKFQEINDSLF